MKRRYQNPKAEEFLEKLGRNDYTFFLFFVISLLGGSYLMLRSRGYLLGYDVLTLLVIMFFFTLLGLPFMRSHKTGKWYTLLFLVPIVLRLLIYQVSASWVDDLDAFIMLAIVASSEEAFRAGVSNALMMAGRLSKGQLPNVPLLVAVNLANLAWLALHFASRGFDGTYFLWLLVTGLCLTVIMVKQGVGMASLGHFCVNLVA